MDDQRIVVEELEDNKLVQVVDKIGRKIDEAIFAGIVEFVAVVDYNKAKDFYVYNFTAQMNSFLLAMVSCVNS